MQLLRPCSLERSVLCLTEVLTEGILLHSAFCPERNPVSIQMVGHLRPTDYQMPWANVSKYMRICQASKTL